MVSLTSVLVKGIEGRCLISTLSPIALQGLAYPLALYSSDAASSYIHPHVCPVAADGVKM